MEGKFSMKAKVSLLFLAPFILLFAVLFVGCGEERDPVSISFDCNSQINLKMGTLENALGNAPLITNYPEGVEIRYDESVIDYDVITGVITPLGAGDTILAAQVEDQIATVRVVVEEAIYCTTLELSDTYRVKLNSSNSAAAIQPVLNTGYNMGLEFVSQTPSIFEVDENGVITPKATGTGTLKVIAKTGCSGNTYGDIWETATIIVEDIATDYSVRILNSEYEPLDLVESADGYDYYELLTGEENARPQYIMEITSNISLKDTFSNLVGVNDGDTASARLFEFATDAYSVISQDGKTLYRPFYATTCGTDYFRFNLIDAALNYENVLPSNTVKIVVCEPVTEIEITLTSEQFADESTSVLEISENEMAELTAEILTNENSTKDFTVDYDKEKLNITVVDNKLNITTSKSGVYTITVTSNDYLGISKSFTFKVRHIRFDGVDDIIFETDEIHMRVGEFCTVKYFTKYDTEGNSIYAVVTNDAGDSVQNDSLFISIEMNIYIEAYSSGTYYVMLSNGAGMTSEVLTIIVE